MKTTFECKYCSSSFAWVGDGWCSPECRAKGAFLALCRGCGREFAHQGEASYCSPGCLPPVVPCLPEVEGECVACGRSFSYVPGGCLGDPDRCSLACSVFPDRGPRLYGRVTTHGPSWEDVRAVALASLSKVVAKGWGLEVHVCNHDLYCLKHLIFNQSRAFSLHHHLLKQELWHCATGLLEVYLERRGGVSEWLTLAAGGKLEIRPGDLHQAYAVEPSILVEVSTTDFPEDSIRTRKGD